MQSGMHTFGAGLGLVSAAATSDRLLAIERGAMSTAGERGGRALAGVHGDGPGVGSNRLSCSMAQESETAMGGNVRP